MSRTLNITAVLVLALASLPALGGRASGQDFKSARATNDGSENVTLLVTVHPKGGRTLPDIRSEDFTVLENGRKQTVVSVRTPGQAPINLAVLIQDDVISRVGNEIKAIKQFILALPPDSRVMVGYITAGSLQVRQAFTNDLKRGADGLRLPYGSASGTPYNPYVEVLEALKKFDDQLSARNEILLVSDGLDTSRGFRSASPYMSIDLDRAIKEAQRRGVAVFTIYAPTVGLTSSSHLATNYGQGSLSRLADETGGEAFFQGTSFVTFDPHLREYKELLTHQWLITYKSDNADSHSRKVEVKLDSPGVEVYHQVLVPGRKRAD